MNPFSVIKRPVLSEKSNTLREDQSKYVFIAPLKATKKEIKKAIMSMYDVDVVSVGTLIQRGKYRRRGMHTSLTSKFKKAIVSLKPGQTIKAFEEQ